MQDVVEKIATCVARGKISKSFWYPPEMKDQDGADEIAADALTKGIQPGVLLDGCMLGMERVGKEFGDGSLSRFNASHQVIQFGGQLRHSLDRERTGLDDVRELDLRCPLDHLTWADRLCHGRARVQFNILITQESHRQDACLRIFFDKSHGALVDGNDHNRSVDGVQIDIFYRPHFRPIDPDRGSLS